jgi:serine/threonine protein kinase
MDKPQVSVKAMFDQAFEMASPVERAAYLDQACAESPELRAQVEALLGAYAEAGSFLENPAPAPVATQDSSPEPPDKAAAVSPLPEGPGSRIGPYKLLQKLGEGGMGKVWVAEQTEPVKRRVALKVIKPGMDSRQVLRRFEAERQALAVMDHSHIAKVLWTITWIDGLRKQADVKNPRISGFLHFW